MRTIQTAVVLATLTSVAGTASAGPPDTPAPGSLRAAVAREAAVIAIGQSDQAVADWQAQYDAARGKRRAGGIWMMAGTGIAAAGILMMTQVEEECAAFVCTLDYRVPGFITSAGVGALAWGITQFRDAGRTMRDLEALRSGAAQRSARAAEIHVAGTGVVSVGRDRAALMQRVAW
jgi:hypothetical protein